MEDPIRLSEEGSDPLTSVLLDAGRHDVPSTERLNRIAGVMTAAGVTVATNAAAAELATAAAGAAPSSLPIAILVKWTGIGMIAGLGVTLGFGALSGTADANRPLSTQEVVASQEVEPARGLAAPPANLKSDPMQESTGLASKRAKRRVAEPSTDSIASSEESARTALREEVAALAVAKAALNRGSPRDALQAVLGYRARFPQGRLMPEAAVIEMDAQLALGNRARALDVARQLERAPTPGAERARELLREGTK